MNEARIMGRLALLRSFRSLVFVTVLALSGSAGAGGSDETTFSDGLRAYDAGDYAATIDAWRPLAEAGNAEAQAGLAGLYADGFGVARDPREAAAWYERAARAGHLVARLNLGDMLARGWGVARDRVAAYAWLELAARQGSDWAAARRDQIALAMSAGEIELARRRVEILRDSC
jgi:TPR repeat protein